jgi:nickel/cobalt exporter
MLTSGRRLVTVALALAALALLAGVVDPAHAQMGPFGPKSAAPPPPPADGFTGWILAKQAEFYRQFQGLIRAAKQDGSALWTLMGVSFLYGIFHAAGPGHGKAVISSYVVANEETWRRGVILSFASALLQALVAVAIVGIAAALLGVTSRVMTETVRYIEIVSYALIAAIGLRLVWVKGLSFVSAWRAMAAPAHAHHHHELAHAHAGHAHHDHAHHDHAHHDHGHHDHGHHNPPHGQHGHVHDEHCGHSHGPEPHELAGPGGWQRGLSAIVAVGLRPCSGAILVLVFALAQGIFWSGVAATFVMGLGTAITVAVIATLAVGAKALAARFAATKPGYGMLALRGIEVGAALLVLVFGVALLAGYMASERLM